MTLFQISIQHYDSLFDDPEINWIEARNLKDAKYKIRNLLKLKKESTNDTWFFTKEENKIKSITIIGEY